MAKHNQRNTLGSLADFQSAPKPPPKTADERIDRLERRLLQVETLLNDVTQQLDKPYRDQPHSNGKPQQARPQQAKPSTAPETPDAKRARQEKQAAIEKEAQAASAKRTAESLEKLQSLLANGDRITATELQAAGISQSQQKKIRKSAAYKESGIQLAPIGYIIPFSTPVFLGTS